MIQIEQTQQAKDFFEYWKDKGDEKQETEAAIKKGESKICQKTHK